MPTFYEQSTVDKSLREVTVTYDLEYMEVGLWALAFFIVACL